MPKEPERELVVYGAFYHMCFNILRVYQQNYTQYDINLT
jgi:hypothetical protein